MSSAVATIRRTGECDPLEIYSLGVVDYPSLLSLQERLTYDLSGRRDCQGVLLLCEHPPVVTVGREGGHAHFCVDEQEFDSQLMEVHWVPRGGGNLIHVPGQLAAYVLLPLDRLSLGVGEFRRRMERALMASCRDARVSTWIRESAPGLWCRTGQVGYFGAAVKSWVTNFGVYLNVSPKLHVLRQCDPTGRGERQSSLEAERQRHVAMNGVRESLARHLAAEFGYERNHWYTGHPLLVRAKKKVYVHS